jgi:hypothetical protein
MVKQTLIKYKNAFVIRIGRRRVFWLGFSSEQPPFNQNRGKSEGRKPAQQERDEQHLEERFTIFAGLSRISTAAKKQSISTWMILRIPFTTPVITYSITNIK